MKKNLDQVEHVKTRVSEQELLFTQIERQSNI